MQASTLAETQETSRITPVNMQAEDTLLSCQTVEAQAATLQAPSTGSCVSWACAAVRG